MNINTELVKNKKYNEAILHRLVKVSQEYRALAVLRYLFPGVYEQMEHGDKPDLQDKINSIEIEVTVAVQGNDIFQVFFDGRIIQIYESLLEYINNG